MLWGGFFDVANRIEKIKEDEHLSASADFWNDPRKAQTIMKQIQSNKQWVNEFNDAKAKVEETTGLKGIKLVRFNEYSPIFGELYKPTLVPLPKKLDAYVSP